MSEISYMVSYLASIVKSPTAHQALFQSSQDYYLECLAKNPNISEGILAELLIGEDSSWGLLRNLARRQTPLADEQITFLLKKASASVVDEVLSSAVPRASYAFQTKLLDKGISAKHATRWLANPATLRAIAPRLVENIIAPELLAHLAPESKISNAEVLATLATLRVDEESTVGSTEAGGQLRNYYLAPLFDTRPALIAPALALRSPYLNEALASSRHIFDQEIFQDLITQAAELIAQPYKGKEFVDDYREGRYLGQRTLVAVASNPNADLTTSKSALKRRTMGAETKEQYGQTKQSTWGHLSYLFGSEGHARVIRIGKLVKAQKKLIATAPWQTLNKKELSKLLQDRYLPAPATTLYPTLHPLAADDTSSTLGKPVKRQVKYSPTAFSWVTAHRGYELSPARAEEFIERRLDPLGAEGWKIFIQGAVGWDGPLSALIDMTELLTSKGYPHSKL